jgi:hypothetical protein
MVCSEIADRDICGCLECAGPEVQRGGGVSGVAGEFSGGDAVSDRGRVRAG